MNRFLLPYDAPDARVFTLAHGPCILAGSEADNTLDDLGLNPIYDEDFFISIL